MKTLFNTTKALLVVAIMIGGAAFEAGAQLGKGSYSYTPGKSKEQAVKVPANAAVMVACGGFQTIQTVKKGGILDLFTPDTKHACPGCGGKITFVGAPGKSGGTTYTHTCSKCGAASAYVCTDHRS